MESRIDFDAITNEMEKAVQVAEREAQECRDRLRTLEAGAKRLRRALADLSPKSAARKAHASAKAATGQQGPTVADLVDEALTEAGAEGISRAKLVAATGRSDSSIGSALQHYKATRGWIVEGERADARWRKRS